MKARRYILQIGLFVLFGMYLYRLFSLQVLKGGIQYITRGKEQFYRTEILKSRRGNIYDRDMRPLAISVEEDNTYKRVYFAGKSASSLIGFVGKDGTGLEGIEYALNEYLRGKDGYRVLYRTADGNYIPLPNYPQKKPKEGASLVLTIDMDIQTYVYQVLSSYFSKYKVKKGFAIVLNPQTGEIIAMTSFPGFEPERFKEYPTSLYRNLPVYFLYEPGSVFKIVPFATAIKENKYSPEKKINTMEGSLTIAGYEIHDPPLENRNKNYMTFDEVLIHSSNIGISRIALKLNKKNFYKMIQDLGFGVQTGIILSGEQTGTIKHYKKWSTLYTANLAFGQGILVNGLQIAMAYAAVANGGLLLQPSILKGIIENRKFRYVFEPKKVRKVFTSAQAELLREKLYRVVEEGSGKRAQIEGVAICGKTGTAQKVDPETGTYSKDKVVMSFIGFFPKDNPEYLIYVVLDEPDKGKFSSSVVAPIFREIAHYILRINSPYQNIKSLVLNSR